MKWTTLWVDDWNSGVMFLTPEERGIFITLMCYFVSKDCGIPDNDHYISRMCNTTLQKYRKAKKVLVEGDFILIKNESIWIDKSEKQWKKDVVFSKLQAEKSRKRHEQNRAKLLKENDSGSTPAHAPAMPSYTPTPTTIKKVVTNVTPKETEKLLLFDEFWKLYPKQRKGNKAKALTAYQKPLSENRATEQEILEGVKNYVGSREVQDGYAKGAAAWLNDDRWTDQPSLGASTGSQGGQRYAGNKEPTSRAAAHRDAINRMGLQQGFRQSGGEADPMPDTSTD